MVFGKMVLLLRILPAVGTVLLSAATMLEASASSPHCVRGGLLVACAPSGGGPISFQLSASPSNGGGGDGGTARTIVSSNAIVAASRRIEFNGNTHVDLIGPTGSQTLVLTAPDVNLSASYRVEVAVVGGSFEVTVSAAAANPGPVLSGSALAAPNCTAGPINNRTNPTGGDLHHFQQPADSADPSLCRALCCATDACEIWALMDTGVPGLGTPCVAGKPCCYLKSAASSAPVPDPHAIASGGKEVKPPRPAPAPPPHPDGPAGSLHNLELEYTFDPPRPHVGAGEEGKAEEGVLKWLPNLHRGICDGDSRQQGTSCYYGNDSSTLTTEHFFRRFFYNIKTSLCAIWY
jgi:hypothetical protein